MKTKIIALLLCLSALFCFASCQNAAQEQTESPPESLAGIELPEDFSFSLTWGVYGVSSYDSASGKLVKESDATDVSKYTAYVKLSENDLKRVYRFLYVDMDLASYPDDFKPSSIQSKPSETIIVTATAGGVTKTVACRNTAFYVGEEYLTKEGKAFEKSVIGITAILTSLPEWEAFPVYERYYM